MQSTSSISSLIWSTADEDLRGLFKPSEYGRVILPFVVMRRLDCVLEYKKEEVYELFHKYKDQFKDPTPVILRRIGLPFYNVSKFDLSRITDSQVLLDFNNYLQGYSQNVLEIIENFTINPLVQKLHKKKRLYQLIKKFAGFDLHPSKIDNHQMGSIYEELLRRFSEMSNEESGDFFTPRDIVKLLVNIIFEGDKEDLQGEGKIRSIYDPCCGTGGMLTQGKEWVLNQINPDLNIDLYGQELNDVTYAICKSDLLILNENPENIYGPFSSLSNDHFKEKKFDYMITNPPFGVSWKSEKEFIDKEAKDPSGRFFAGIPGTSDGSFLFLQSLIHKMNPKGSRIGIIFNGSPLFKGDAGTGESEIRKWIIEEDLLECIIQLPDQMFFNTDITTYIWILSNKKIESRKGKIQLIDGSSFYEQKKKSLGRKRKEISIEQINELLKIYNDFEEGDFSQIYSNNFFGYTKVIVEQPLIENGKVVLNKKGVKKIDQSKKDYERVPLIQDIKNYFAKEVEPYLDDFWLNRKKDKVGYVINFSEYFYKKGPIPKSHLTIDKINILNNEILELSSTLKERNLLVYKNVVEGFEPNLEFKDSGIKWINKIPINWEVKKLKYISKIVNGATPKSYVEKYWDGKIKWFTPSDFKNLNIEGYLHEPFRFISEEGLLNSGCTYIEEESILMTTRAPVGNLAKMKGGYTFNQGCKAILPEYINLDYLYMYLNIQQDILYALSNGTTFKELSTERLMNLKVPVPPTIDQIRIGKLLNRETLHIKNLINQLNTKIEQLGFYKQSIISSSTNGHFYINEEML